MQQELQTVAKTFFDKIVLLSTSYFQFRLNHHTHYESYLKYSVSEDVSRMETEKE